MKDIIIAIIGSGVLSGLLATIVSTVNTNRQKQKDNTAKLEEGLRLILLSTLKRDGREALSQGSLSKEDYEALCASYNAYKALGGDGWADKIFGQNKKLPVDLDD